MIRLICPSCSASYDVPDTAIPAHGRKVRCQLCGESWHQHPIEIDLIGGDDEPHAIDDTTPEAFGELLRSVLEEPDHGQKAPAPPKKSTATQGTPTKTKPARAASGFSWAGLWTGLVTGVALLGAYGAFGVMAPQHTPLWMDLQQATRLLTLSPTDPATQLRDTLAFERMELIARPEGGYVLRGIIINLSSYEQPIPALSLVWNKADGGVIATLPLLLTIDRIPAEGQFAIDHVIETPPPGATTLSLAGLLP